MKLAEALADVLVQEEVDTVFGLVGGGMEEIVACCIDRGIRYVKARHEQGAVGMADGYSRVTGRVGVALVSHGAGLSNAGTAMIVARKARSRVLVVTSDTGDDEPFMPHKFDQETFLHSTIEQFTTIRSTTVAERVLTATFKTLAGGGGPVAINLPTPIATADVPVVWAYRPVRERRRSVPVEPQERAVMEVEKLIRSSKRPVLLAGRGAAQADARQAMIALAECTGAVLAETLHAKGYFRGHPQAVGISGGFGDPESQTVLAEADIVVAFGASLSRYTSKWGQLFSDAKVVTVDTLEDAEPQMTATYLHVVADARLTAEALLQRMGDTASDAPAPWHTQSMDASGPADDRETRADGSGGELSLRDAVLRLDAALARPRGLVIDGGNSIALPAALFGVDDPLDQICPWEFWSIGVGVSIAVGAAIGRPERVTVAFLGDGALMLGLADLETAVRYHAPLIVVVSDNGGFDAERTSFDARSLDRGINDFDNPDISAVARGLGLEAYRATDRESLESCVEKLSSFGPDSSPALLTLQIDKAAASPEMDRVFVGYKPV